MKKSFTQGLLLLLCLLTAPINGQDYSASISGTIKSINQDDGYVVIGENKINFKAGQVKIYYKKKQLRSADISAGMWIRYTLNKDGSISAIWLQGPLNILDSMEKH